MMVDKKTTLMFVYTKEIEATKLNHQTIHENAFFGWLNHPEGPKRYACYNVDCFSKKIDVTCENTLNMKSR